MRILSTLRLVPLALAAGLLTACASVPPPQPYDRLLADRLFGPPTEHVSTDAVLTVDAAMRHYLEVDIADQLRRKGAQNGLIEALYKHSQLKLDYDTGMTKTAAEAFASRSGNCLSLVIMTAALAGEMKLPVVYQSAELDETWSRIGDLMFASGHVNVTVGRSGMDVANSRTLSPLTVDFLPPQELRRLRTHEIGEATVLAMYANNRAAEALAQGRIDDAYAWTVEALRRDAGFVSAYNTLGVIYMRHGDLAEAAMSFDRALELQPRNTRALANLAQSYDRQGRTSERDAVRKRLAAIEPDPPFHFFNLGLEAMRRNDWQAARDYFSREVDRADYYDEFHFWLALADWRLGDFAQATKQLRLAMDNSTTHGQRDLYAAKLQWLQSHARPHADGDS